MAGESDRVTKPYRSEAAVNAAFGAEPSKLSETYLQELHSNWREISDAMGRRTTLLVLTIVLFELLTRAIVVDLSLGPVKLRSYSTIERFLPIVIAYLTLEQILWSVRWTKIRDTYQAMMKIHYPAIYRHDLETLLVPRLPAIWTLGTGSDAYLTPRASGLVALMTTVLTLIMMGAALLFPGYEFYRLFRVLHGSDPLFWVSAAITAALTAAACWYLFLYVSEREE